MGTVSVIIPVWNARETIAETLRSVERQSEPPLEIIVIDDGSTDGVEDAICGAKVRYHRQTNGGPSAARNRGFALSTGSLVAFLDADDLLPEDSLRVLGGYFNREPELDVVQGKIQDLWPDLEHGGTRLEAPRWALNLGGALFRRSVLERLGGFDPSLRTGEDFDFWLRCKEQNVRHKFVEDVCLYYRRRLSESVDAKRDFHRGRILALKKSLDRGQSR